MILLLWFNVVVFPILKRLGAFKKLFWRYINVFIIIIVNLIRFLFPFNIKVTWKWYFFKIKLLSLIYVF